MQPVDVATLPTVLPAATVRSIVMALAERTNDAETTITIILK